MQFIKLLNDNATTTVTEFQVLLPMLGVCQPLFLAFAQHVILDMYVAFVGRTPGLTLLLLLSSGSHTFHVQTPFGATAAVTTFDGIY